MGQHTELNVKTVLFQIIQFSISTQFKYKNSKLSKPRFSSISPIDRTLSVATTHGQSGPGSDGNKGVFRNPQSSNIIATEPSDYLVSYNQDTLWGRGLTTL